MQRGKVRSISKREEGRSGRVPAGHRCGHRQRNPEWRQILLPASLLATLLASSRPGSQRQMASGWPRVPTTAGVVSSQVLPSSGVGRCCSMGKEIHSLSAACSPRFRRVWTVSRPVPGARFQKGAASLYASARDRHARTPAAGVPCHSLSETANLPREWCQVSMYGFGRFRSPNAASKGGRRGLPNPRSLGWGREKPFGTRVEHRFGEKWFPPDTAASF